MILNKLEISNFKCFSESIQVPISKLTLITGANSSGKSSIIASILGAVQSAKGLKISRTTNRLRPKTVHCKRAFRHFL